MEVEAARVTRKARYWRWLRAATMLVVALAIAAPVAVIIHGQSQLSNTGKCARKLSGDKAIADAEWQHLWTGFVTEPITDQEQAKRDLNAADAKQFAAAAAVKAFADHPVLPCPAGRPPAP